MEMFRILSSFTEKKNLSSMKAFSLLLLKSINVNTLKQNVVLLHTGDPNPS